MTQRILGISGRKESGKDTTCNFIFGNAMCSIIDDETEQPLIDYFKIDDAGRLVVPSKTGEGIFDLNRQDFPFVYFMNEKVWHSIKRYSFASKLKQIAIEVFGLSYEQCWGTNEQKNSKTQYLWENLPFKSKEDKKKTGLITAREFLQYLGTSIFRNIYSNVWVDSCIREIKNEEVPLVLINDVRYENEIKGIKDAGGLVIRLTRKPHDDTHSSETELDKYEGFDKIIDNQDMSITESNQAVYEFLKEVGWIT